jgi:16S rRNA (cytidine1402-2'-O)-methyltransferase
MQVGTLFIVATPIGNLDDFTPRAVQILQEVDLVAAEDTRHSKPLLEKFAITTPLRSYHDFSSPAATQRLLDVLCSGQSIALISDAGTPLISDPGYRLVREVRNAGITVLPVPGASALTAALSVSGLATDRFTFEGFLPAKAGTRQNALKSLAQETRTLVFYESPHRIRATLTDMCELFGSAREIFVGRELTKMFETHFLGTLEAALGWLDSDANNERGEFVLVVQGCASEELQDQSLASALLLVKGLRSEVSLKRAVALASELTGVRKNTLYQAALEQESGS